MTFDHVAISASLICPLILFIWGRLRYRVIAVLSLVVGFGVINLIGNRVMTLARSLSRPPASLCRF